MRVYAVVDTDCQHRQTIYDALQLKYQNYMLSNGQSDAVSTSLNGENGLGVVLTPDNKPIAPIPDDDPLPFYRRADIETPNIGDRAELENIQSGTDTLAFIADLPTDEASEGLGEIRSVWTAEFLVLASKNLTFAQRVVIKKLVVELNASQLAS